jgi:hypothetical protein
MDRQLVPFISRITVVILNLMVQFFLVEWALPTTNAIALSIVGLNSFIVYIC